METRFDVLSEITNKVEFDSRVKTSHWTMERMERHEKIMRIIGNGEYMTSFVVDKGHKDGAEIHNIYSNGIILIENRNTHRMITELIARPNQIRRYFTLLGKNMSAKYDSIITKCIEHQRKGYNYW